MAGGVEEIAMIEALRIRLSAGAPSDLELVAFGEANPGWQIERGADGELLLSPTNSAGGAKSTEALAQLLRYRAHVGGHAYDSSTGFTMPDGSVLSPDASWISDARYAGIDRTTTFWRVVPDVVVEVASWSDRWSAIVDKVERYARFGAGYALAIDPRTREVHAVGTPPDGLAFDADAVVDA